MLRDYNDAQCLDTQQLWVVHAPTLHFKIASRAQLIIHSRKERAVNNTACSNTIQRHSSQTTDILE